MNEVARENDMTEMLDQAVSVRMAFGANKSEWQKFVKGLNPDHKVKETVSVDSKEQLNAIRRLLKGGRGR